MNDASELKSALSSYTGTDCYFFNPLNPSIKYTNGAKFFWDNAGGGAHWLLTILITQPEILNAAKVDPFVLIRLHVNQDMTAKLIVDNGNDPEYPEDYRLYYQRDLDYTDCPAGLWTFYLRNGVILIPSEY